ncbi:hypothetical protein [Saccharophagus sp. K07]|jgi:hypothetical protein|uniref:hypothetical protein n=1 Tax=Saccharophagus sp. K07 TaxID=2283636 RepID=UPI0016523E69|nr:hypothetical protein [Saccharophagus sp. K07]
MCFQKPRRIPKHLLLQPEPAIYRRPHKSIARSALIVLVLLGFTIAGVANSHWIDKPTAPFLAVLTHNHT